MKRFVIILAVLVMLANITSWCLAEDPNTPPSPPSATGSDGHESDGPGRFGPGRGNYGRGNYNGRYGRGQMPDNPSDPNSNEPDRSAENDEGDTGESEEPLVAINLNNVEMKNLLPKIAAWSGKVILPSNEAMAARITIFSPKEVTQSKALSLIFDALRDKGIIAEISEDKLYLKPTAKAKIGTVPVLGVDEPLARIEDTSRLVEKYFKIKNTSPSKLVNVIAPLTASYGHVAAHESSHSLAVIDTVENLFRIEKTIAQFDVPESGQIVEEIFKIENGDAIEIVQVFQLIYQQTTGYSQNRRRSSYRRRDYNEGNEGDGKRQLTPATASTVIIEEGDIPIILLPIPKHNWIIARASTEDMKNVKKWIAKLDIAETKPQEQTIVSVSFVEPEEVVRLVRNAIQNMPGSELKTSVVVEAMRDSKQVVVFGSEENRNYVEGLIKEIDLPIEDIYIIRVFKLEHIDPDEVKENLEALYEQESGEYYSSSYGRRGSYSRMSRNIKPEEVVKVTSFPKLKQVSVVATEEKMKKIEGQIKEWDSPMNLRKNQYMLMTLKNSDPVEMVTLLSKLFSEEDNDSGRSFLRMIFGGSDALDSKKKIVGSLYGMLTFEAVPGTKKILIISKAPEAYPVIKDLVEDLDKQEKGEVPRVITLNYADPEELCDQLNAMLNPRGTTATLKRRQQGLSATDFSGDNSSSGSGNNSSNQATNPGEMAGWWNRAPRNDNEMPLSNLIGKVRFIPVHRSKALLALAPPEYLLDIEKMVEDLDKPEMQVMIEAVIVEVDHSSMTSLGVQFSSNPVFFNAIGQNAFKGDANFNFVKEISKGLKLSANTDINVLLDLLKKTVNAKILNQPNLWAKDNEEAKVFKGKTIRVLESSQQAPTGSVENTYEPEQVGVELKVRPNITPAKDVNITIKLIISDLAVETVNDQPVINRLDTETNLIVADGETIMLGGILFQNQSTIKSKVPLLGDIPVVGAAFNHEDSAIRNNELLVFLTPHVITDNEKNSDAAKKYLSKPKIQAGEADKGGSKTIKPIDRMKEIRKSLDDMLIMQMQNGEMK